MNEAVMVPGIAMMISMGAIVVLGTVGGLLLQYLDKRMSHGRTH